MSELEIRSSDSSDSGLCPKEEQEEQEVKQDAEQAIKQAVSSPPTRAEVADWSDALKSLEKWEKRKKMFEDPYNDSPIRYRMSDPKIEVTFSTRDDFCKANQENHIVRKKNIEACEEMIAYYRNQLPF